MMKIFDVHNLAFTPTLALPLKGEGLQTWAQHQFLPPQRGGERSEGAIRMGVETLECRVGRKNHAAT
jgi:hypothetical protein